MSQETREGTQIIISEDPVEKLEKWIEQKKRESSSSIQSGSPTNSIGPVQRLNVRGRRAGSATTDDEMLATSAPKPTIKSPGI